MDQAYRVLAAGGEAEIVEKKSQFIASVSPVKSENEALRFIDRIRKKYWDARHHCYAYCLGQDNQTQRCSDDGEPSLTAGRPILDVILGEDIHDACIVVTRYFGGTLLGTGGLVRAYSTAAGEGLKNSRSVLKRPGRRLVIITDYTSIGKIRYILKKHDSALLDTRYTDKVELEVIADEDDLKGLTEDIREAAGVRTAINLKSTEWFADLDGEILLDL